MTEATVRREGATLYLSGTVNSDTGADLYQRLTTEVAALSESASTGASLTLDCSALINSDSTAVALLIGACRAVDGRNSSIRVSGLSGELLSLARLYDVGEMLGLVEAGEH